ncbi:MAG: hypothetical protein KatS3mg115_1284 [Candidatus Poribacteria bacterium]|nr:MAG: hypothetical protein KatS3mg115_1284 [Candidatus Poribacteria bacterium]
MRSRAVERREEALHEIAQTEFSRRGLAVLLTLALLATIGAVPLVQLITEWRDETPGLPHPLSVFRMLPRLEEFRQVQGIPGLLELLPSLREIHEFETQLEETSVVSGWILPRAQYALTAIFGVGNEQAYIGRKRWLFYRPGVDYLIGPGFLEPEQMQARIRGAKGWEDPPHPDPIAPIIQLAEALKAYGATLVVVPTPVKPSVYPDYLSSSAQPPAEPLQNPSYEAFLRELERNGVRVFDPGPILTRFRREGGRAYLRTDTHWTPEAMERVAQALADYLVREGLVPRPAEGRYRREERQITNLGDIAIMLKLPAGQRLYRPEMTTIHPVVREDGAPWRPDPRGPVLLLGDSFSNIYSLEGMGWGADAGFGEQLSFFLQQPIDRIVQNAGGAYATREALQADLRRGADRLRGKRVVVYQFAARELAVGDWRPIPLPEPTLQPTLAQEGAGPIPSTEPKPDAAEVLVGGTIRAISRPPAPGSVPYPDAIIALHLVELHVISGAFPEPEALVFAWGMREGRWTELARRNAGERVRFRLIPWDQVSERYGSYVRVELDDEATFLLVPYWGEAVP